MGASGPPATGRVLGVLVTYRRPRALATMLGRLAAQAPALASLLVIDNEDAEDARAIVRARAPASLGVEYLAPGENLGPAGGFALGMRRALERAGPEDWILLLDDDNPPPEHAPSFLRELAAFASAQATRDSRTGAVGAGGAWFDARRGRMRRVGDERLSTVVAVDCIANSLFPLYRVAAVRAAGVQDGRLFFGFGELEYGLRLQAAGYRLYLAGALCRQRRAGPAHRGGAPRLLPPWRRYYGVRNLVHLLRAAGHPVAALRVTVLQGVVRPLLSPAPGESRGRTLRLALRGARDGWQGRLGRQVEPAVSDRT